MISLSYTLTPDIKKTLAALDTIRHHLLLTPLPPKTERRLRWQALVERIAGSLTLAETPVPKVTVADILSLNKRPKTPADFDVLAQRNTNQDVWERWAGSIKPLTAAGIETLTETLTSGTARLRLRRTVAARDGDIKKLLEFLQTREEHPVILAGLAHYGLLTLLMLPDQGVLARMGAWVLLTKFGYDIRQLLAPEREWAAAPQSYRRAYEDARASDTLTPWLSYCIETATASLEELQKAITRGAVQTDLPASWWELTDRQKALLSLLSDPAATITNKKVQQRFKISQITASRDLSKLTALGLLYPHGKGRSIYYTRI